MTSKRYFKDSYEADELIQHIGECGLGRWEPMTGKQFPEGGQPWQLFLFENDVEWDGATWRCTFIDKRYFDEDRPDELDYSEIVFAEAFEL